MTHDEIIAPQTVKLIREEGMPIQNESSEDLMRHLKTVEEMPKGDLYLKFDIQFPKKIQHGYKEAIIQALRSNQEETE